MSTIQDMAQFSRPTNSQLNLDLYSTTGAVTGCPGSASNVAGAEGCPGPSLYMVGGKKKSRRYSKKMHRRLGRKKYRGGGYSFRSQPQNSSPSSFGGGPSGHLGQFSSYDNASVACPSNMGASRSYSPGEMSQMATESGYITGGKRRTRRRGRKSRRRGRKSRRGGGRKVAKKKRRTRSRRGAGGIEDFYTAAKTKMETFTKKLGTKKCPEAMKGYSGSGKKRLELLRAVKAMENKTFRRPQDGHSAKSPEECPEPNELPSGPNALQELGAIECVTMEMTGKPTQCRIMGVKDMKKPKCPPGCAPSMAAVSASDAAAATAATDASLAKDTAAADDTSAAAAASSAAVVDGADAARDTSAADNAAAREQVQPNEALLPPADPAMPPLMPSSAGPDPAAQQMFDPTGPGTAPQSFDPAHAAPQDETAFAHPAPLPPFQPPSVPADGVLSGGRRRTRGRKTRSRKTRNRKTRNRRKRKGRKNTKRYYDFKQMRHLLGEYYPLI